MTDVYAFNPNSSVRRVRDLFVAAGFEIYLVGGSVRDFLSGADPDDLDFTTNARPNEIEAVLDAFTQWDAGKDFGTIAAMVCNRKVEVTTFRADRYRPNDRHPVVEFGDRIEDDLFRRDFTVNAMAINLTTGDLVDPYEGQIDLERRFLATPQKAAVSMSDDPLRVLRAVRFASVRGFEMSSALRAAIDLQPLDTISQERKTAELEKILAAGPDAVYEAAEICTPRLRKELFGPFWLDVAGNEEIFSLDRDASPRTILAFFASYLRSVESVPLAFGELRLSNDVARHCRNVFRIIVDYWNNECDVAQVVRDNSDEVLADATAILRARGVKDNEYFLLGYRDNLRRPLPVDGNDLLAIGLKGSAIGDALRVIEKAYLNDCYLTKQDALALLS